MTWSCELPFRRLCSETQLPTEAAEHLARIDPDLLQEISVLLGIHLVR
jgi:hypothetical protein